MDICKTELTRAPKPKRKKRSGTWMIYNIIFDQVNLVKNYQSQFNQIIAKNKLEGLMNTMRKKLKENTSEVDAAL